MESSHSLSPLLPCPGQTVQYPRRIALVNSPTLFQSKALSVSRWFAVGLVMTMMEWVPDATRAAVMTRVKKSILVCVSSMRSIAASTTQLMSDPRFVFSIGWCACCSRRFGSQPTAATHKNAVHHYCGPCARLFGDANGLQNHIDNAAAHNYQPRSNVFASATVIVPVYGSLVVTRAPEFSCIHCTDGFDTFYEVDCHRLNYHSDIKNHACPFCSFRHASLSAVTAHFDSGGCPGGANRQCVDQRTIGATVNNCFGVGRVIVPRRSAPIGPTITYSTTEMARNSRDRYGCYFCPGMDFATFSQLKQHLESPKHSKRTPGMYTCPMCRIKTQTLSGLIQHAEMGGCGVRKDARVQGALEGLTQGMEHDAGDGAVGLADVSRCACLHSERRYMLILIFKKVVKSYARGSSAYCHATISFSTCAQRRETGVLQARLSCDCYLDRSSFIVSVHVLYMPVSLEEIYFGRT